MDFPLVYAVKHKDMEIRMASRSGGVFTALSDVILQQNGVIYGCVLNERFEAVHVRTEDAKHRNFMRGSKYIQSDLKNTFQQVKADLLNGKKVLFSGTSCQIAGLKSFLGKKANNNLLCVDIVCHGVPSPLIWQKYLNWQEETHHGNVVSVDFRNKKDFGWAAHIETLDIQNGQTKIKHISSDVFKTMFYGHWILRPSCYQCPYKSTLHPGDITIADYWGIDTAAPGFNDNKGVSLVLINNDKGNKLFELIRNALDVKNTRIEDSMQPPLQAPFPEPPNRYQFWRDYEKNGFDYIAKKYGTVSFFAKFKRKFKKIIRLVVK